jgi:hypothetical protein
LPPAEPPQPVESEFIEPPPLEPASAEPPPPASPPRHHSGALVAIVVLTLLALPVIWFYFHDETAPIDTDLAVTSVVVPDNKNGIVQLAHLPARALDFIAFAKDQGISAGDAADILDGSVRNVALVDAYLAQVQPAFAQLDAILALPHFANPGAVYPLPKFPEIAPTLAVAKALRLSVQRNLELNRFSAAVQDTLRLRTLATRLTENYAFFNQYLLAHAIYDYSATCARALLNAPDLPIGQQIVIAAAYSANEPSTAAFQRSLAMEYQYIVAELSAEQKGESLFAPDASDAGPLGYLKALWLHLTVKPNTTRHQLADFYRAWRRALNGPYSTIDTHALAGYRELPSAQDSLLIRLVDYSAPNSGGRFFYRQSLPSAGLLQEPYLQVADDRLLRTGFALRRYYNDYGNLPPTLSQLVPQYLATIPSFPYEEQPLHYNQPLGLVYSLGTTLKDTGGSRFIGQLPGTPGYVDPLLDPAQPTLVLTFQNRI